MINIVLDIFSYLSLFGAIGIIMMIILLISSKYLKNKNISTIKLFISRKAYYIALFLSLIATLGSLFISEIAQFKPCVLCWYQRIAMYPQPFLLFIAIFRKENVLKPYLITMNIIGSLLALEHYLLQVLPKSQFITCNKALTGIAVSCTENYHFYFGFMSFPLMAFIIFVLLIIIILMSPNAKSINRSK